MEIGRARAQADDDYSQCTRSLHALELKVEQLISQSGAGSSKVMPPKSEPKVDINIDTSFLSPMQRGLYKQIGGALNRLIPNKRKDHLQQLRHNLSGQAAGSTKDQ